MGTLARVKTQFFEWQEIYSIDQLNQIQNNEEAYQNRAESKPCMKRSNPFFTGITKKVDPN